MVLSDSLTMDLLDVHINCFGWGNNSCDGHLWSSRHCCQTPREFDFGGQWDLITEVPLGKQRLWRAQTKPYVQPDDAGKLYALCLFFDIQSIRGIRARSVLPTHGLLLVH